MRRIAMVALGALGVSAVCFAVRAAIPHNDGDFSLPFLDFLDFGSGKPACRTTRNNREIATRDFAWAGWDSVTIGVPAAIRYRRGTGERVNVRARDSVLDHIRVEDGRIELDCRNMDNFGEVEIALPGVAIKRFAISGAGKMYLENLEQADLTISVTGAATVEANGQADNAHVSIAGVGKVNMGGLAARRLSVNIAGSGDVDVAPRDSATISIAGAGRVTLLTEPKELNTRIAGAGRIIHGAR